MKTKIRQSIAEALQALSIQDIPVQLDYLSDQKLGDFASNVALIAAKQAGKTPREFAQLLVKKLQEQHTIDTLVAKIEIAGPGFINLTVKDNTLIAALYQDKSTGVQIQNKKIVVEFAHPNTHKAFHIGHLRNITTGESLVRLLEKTGQEVVRANYQGDVGMHIAKCLYGIEHNSELSLEQAGSEMHERVKLLGKAYTAGSKAYEESPEAQVAIRELNKKIYAKDQSIWKLYQTTRKWSLDYFDSIYKRLDTHFDRLYFESEVYQPGKETVLSGVEKGIFSKSDGAIIFPGSQYKLHDRVFITSEGNPTYEGKELGLGPLQFKENNPDLIIHVVGPEQSGYFQVVFEALAQLFPETRGKELHVAYGWVKLKHGKMSSRSGNVVLGEWLLDEAKKKIIETFDTTEDIAEQIAVGAVKYSFLKVGLTQEIAFDLDESISLQGNSGPYVQYVYARTQSVLGKANEKAEQDFRAIQLSPEEREVLRLLERYSDVISEAAEKYAPNLLCTYLFTLAQAYNTFYQKQQIIKAEEPIRAFRLALTQKTGETLKEGLQLLGIQAPEKM